MIRVNFFNDFLWFDGFKALLDACEWQVPINTVRPSQHRSTTRYINRRLPNAGRTRGDVGVA